MLYLSLHRVVFPLDLTWSFTFNLQEVFGEGKAVILTLKDQNILDEKEDVLVNVNIVDEERYKKNNEIKQQKPGYKAYEEEEIDELGLPKTKSLLAKYDTEIDGDQRESFVLGREGDEEARFKMALKEKLKEQQKRIETLESRPLQIASEYYTPEEMTAFKKPKRRIKKIRTKEILKADDLLQGADADAPSSDLGSRSKKRKVEAEEPSETADLSDVKIAVDESNLEVRMAMQKARRLKEKKSALKQWSIEELAKSIKREPVDQDHDPDAMEVTAEDAGRGNIILNATAEFCRTLGDIPTYGMAGNRDEDEEELLV